MSGSEEIMMPVTKPEAVSMAEIHALRSVSDAMVALGRRFESMEGKFDDVRERVIKMEAREYERQIEVLSGRLETYEERINDLEGSRDRALGAKGMMDWLKQFAPWLLAFAGGYGIKAAGVGS